MIRSCQFIIVPARKVEQILVLGSAISSSAIEMADYMSAEIAFVSYSAASESRSKDI